MLRIALLGGASLLLVACSSPSAGEPDSGAADAAAESAAPDAGPTGIAQGVRPGDPSDVPVDGLTTEWITQFNLGDAEFGTTLREADGLGPLYTRAMCASCHKNAGRGPGVVEKMVVVQADGVTPAADQSLLTVGSLLPAPEHTVHANVVAPATIPIVPPVNPPVTVKLSFRLGPPVFGRGYMEALADSTIVAMAATEAARTDGIHGRVNMLPYASEPNSDTRFHAHKKGDTVLGRFGLKARIPTLDDFAADALNGDMGITSPLRPTEFANPDGLTDDAKPGVDVTYDQLNQRADYTRMISIPGRAWPMDPKGVALFDQVKCSACHVPSMHTRADYPIPPLADVEAPLYTDMLLHDMGDGLADGMAYEGQAGPRDWRTAPLIGLRFLFQYMHDGRAKTVEEAILAHDGNGSEAHESVTLYSGLTSADQATLLKFVGTL